MIIIYIIAAFMAGYFIGDTIKGKKLWKTVEEVLRKRGWTDWQIDFLYKDIKEHVNNEDRD